MGEQPEKFVCANCGYTSDGKFTGDICPLTGSAENADSLSQQELHRSSALSAKRSANS